MPSTLPQSTFDLLFVYNGPWGPTANPAGVIGNDRPSTAGSDDLTYTSVLNLLVNGDAGNDRITINGGLASTINGGSGSDQIFGGSGLDAINGGDGNDYIVGGAGPDVLNGNAGIDTVSYENATATGSIGITLTLNASGGGLLLNAGSTNVGIDNLSNFDNVVGTNFNDTITGNASANVLVGRAGNDTLNGGGGIDTIIAGDGNDTLNGGNQLDTLIGGNGNDTINGDQDADLITGGPGADTMTGGNGSEPFENRFFFLTKADLIGDQIFNFKPAFASELIPDKLDFSAIDPDGDPSNGNGTFDPTDFVIVNANLGGGADAATVQIAGQAGVLHVEFSDTNLVGLTSEDFVL
jgi:Ca2+-binding RTX toxin-like protein